MPAVTQQKLRADFAAKLSELETGTAVLERDARKERTGLIERGFTFPHPVVDLSTWQAVRARVLAPFARVLYAAGLPVRWLVRIAPYIAAGMRFARRCVIDAAICVVAAAGVLFPITLAILVFAPPE